MPLFYHSFVPAWIFCQQLHFVSKLARAITNVLNAVARMVVAYGDQLRDETFKEKVGALSIRQLSRTAKERGGGSLSYAEAMLVAYNRKCKYTLKWSKLHADKAARDGFDDEREATENSDERL